MTQEIIIWRFIGIDNLYSDADGNFFYNDKLAKKVYCNGTIQIRSGKFSKGIKSLRKIAFKTQVQKEILPF